MEAVFVILAILAYIAFVYHAAHRNAHGMAYSTAVFGGWVLALLLWTGRIG